MKIMSSSLTGSSCVAHRAAFNTLKILAGLAAFLVGATFLQAQTGTALVRHAPGIGGRIDGSVQQMLGEGLSLNNGNAIVTGDLLVPGTPTILQNGHPTYGGTVDGTGSGLPNNYQITLNGGAALRHVVRRTDPNTLPAVSAPPAPAGMRTVNLSSASQTPGDFSTLRNLTLNGNVGLIAVPAGTYGAFTANGGSGFILGSAGSAQPVTYNLQSLSLNGTAQLQIVGPVILNLGGNLILSGSVGSAARPTWLVLNLASGGLTLNANGSLFGYVTAPAGSVMLGSGAQLIGGLVADRLTLNSNSLLRLQANVPPAVALSAPVDGAAFVAPAAIALTATATDSDGNVSKVDFYQGTTLLGSSTTAPYQFNWTNVMPGLYSLTAVGTDNFGASTVSSPVTISVSKAPATVTLGSLRQTYDGTAKNATATTLPVGLTVFLTYDGASVAPVAAGSYTVTGTIDDPLYAGSATDTFVITPATPTVVWNAPLDIAVGTPLSATQLSATANVPGTFTYSPAAGTVLSAGDNQTLSVTFTPTDTNDYNTVTTSTAITVLPPVPATITLDGVGSATNLNATTTLTWQHTLAANPGSSRAVVVGVVTRGSSIDKASVGSVTFGGVPMLSLDTSVANAGTSTVNRSQLFYLLDAALPAAGTYDVLVTFGNSQSTSNNPVGGSLSLTNVSQDTPTGYSNNNTLAKLISTTVPALAGSWVVDTAGIGSSKANLQPALASMVPWFNISQASGTPSSGAAGATTVADASGSVTMAWTSVSAREVQSLAVFAPALLMPTAPIIAAPLVSKSANVGDKVTFSITATGTAPLSFQWYKNSIAIPNANSASLVLANVQTSDAGAYSVTVNNVLGTASAGPATLTVNILPPVIVTPPASQSVNVGDSVTLSTTVTGSAPLTYQWLKDGAVILGANTASLTLNGVQITDAGSYQVYVSNAAGSVLSDGAILTVNAAPVPPSIVVPPVSQTVGVGSDVTFTVVTTGTAPLTYQWYHDDALLSGATAATLVLTNVQFGDAGSYTVAVGNVAGSVTSSAATLTINPLTTPTALYNLTGFATLGTGTTGGGVVAETDPTYRKVYTALDLAAALKASKTTGAVKVIEIMNDLDLGWNEIGAAAQASPFRAHNAPKLHPALIAAGVSLIDIQSKPGLTIFSANGATIRHATFNFKGTSNIIVRNLKFDELWEWDEATKGNYDSNDWDFIDLSNGSAATNVWIDHCTFTKTYDGIVDMKAGTQYVTMSWCKYTGDDGATNPNSFVRQQIAALEANPTAYPFYNFLRTNGFSVEDIVQIQQGHDKCHLLGANSLDSANATLSATFHHQWFKNIWDRCVPRLRGGQVHDYNIYVDDTDVLVAKRLRDARAAAMSAANSAILSNTYSFNPPINGSISTEGGAILVENSVYIDCLRPLRNNQTDVTNPAYTGKILATDTIYSFLNTDGTITTVRGNSTDDGNPLGPFQAAIIPFSWNTYTGVPYSYTIDDPADVQAVVTAGAGAGTISWSKDNWLKTTY